MTYANVTDRSDPELGLALDEETLDPEMEYRWGHIRPERQTALKLRGYRPVSRSQDEVKLLIDPDQSEDEEDEEDDVRVGSTDDTIKYGDTILMCAPKKLVAERRQRIARSSRERLTANKDRFMEQAERASHQLGQRIPVVGPDREDET